MSDLNITGSSVVRVSGTPKAGTAGASLTAGKLVYKDAADSKLKLADSNGSGTKEVAGLVLAPADANQPASVLDEGVVTVGNILTAGVIYVASDTPGGIKPSADLTSGETVTVVGVAISATQLYVKVWNTGAVK